MQPTLARIEQVAPEDEGEAKGSERFPPVSSKLARNFFITDTYYESPPAGAAPAASDRADSADFLASFNGLSAVSDDIRDLLPPECRKAFENAALQDGEWRSRWGTESDNMSRRDPVIDKAIVPYSMN